MANAAQYTVEQLQAMLAEKQSERAPVMSVTMQELAGLGACTYWLASLYRQGVCLPRNIGKEIAYRAYLLRTGLLLSPEPKLYVVPPLPIPYKALFQFSEPAAAQQALRYLCLLGLATLRTATQVHLEVK